VDAKAPQFCILIAHCVRYINGLQIYFAEATFENFVTQKVFNRNYTVRSKISMKFSHSPKFNFQHESQINRSSWKIKLRIIPPLNSIKANFETPNRPPSTKNGGKIHNKKLHLTKLKDSLHFIQIFYCSSLIKKQMISFIKTCNSFRILLIKW